ncbi:MAG: sigma-70 family RNA polymerase sigma factor [Blastococcus sp.]
MDRDNERNPVAGLVAAAINGDRASWNSLVDRYSPLVLSIVHRYRLQGGDAEDVVQTVWLRLVENLRGIRQPEALPGWIVTTARNECLHVLKGQRHVVLADLAEEGEPEGTGAHAIETHLLESERHEALLMALAELPERQRALLLLLIEDPPLSYEDISRRLDIPIGSIGPTRARALARVRAYQAVQALLNA